MIDKQFLTLSSENFPCIWKILSQTIFAENQGFSWLLKNFVFFFQDTLHAPPAKEIKLEDHCEYKYWRITLEDNPMWNSHNTTPTLIGQNRSFMEPKKLFLFHHETGCTFYRFTSVVSHLECWSNKRKVCESQGDGEWFRKFLRIFPTFRVSYI